MSYEARPGTIPHRVFAHMELLHKGSEISNPMLANALGVNASNLIRQLEPAVAAGAIFVRQKGGHLRSPMFWSLVDHSTKEVTKVQPPAAVSPIRLNAPRHEASSEAAQLEGKESGEGHADRRPPANGLTHCQNCPNHAICSMQGCGRSGVDMDAVHRTRDNVIEMEPAASLTAPAVDAHEHFARTTIDQVPVFLSKPAAKPEVRCSLAGTTPYRFGIFNDGEFVQEKAGQRIVIDRDELEQLLHYLDRMAREAA